MIAHGTGRLAPDEHRAVLRGTVYRVVGTPLIAALGLLNTAIIVRETGANVFGLVSLVGTFTLLFPFVDLGIGMTVMSAAANLTGAQRDPNAVDVIRRGYRVLGAVALAITGMALTVMAFDKWSVFLGISTGPADRWAITAATVLFAATIPAGLGTRILIGIDRNQFATVALMSSSAFTLGATLILAGIGVDGIWFAMSSLTGVLVSHLIATVLALRISGLGWSAFGSVSVAGRGKRLLAGSLWLFVAAIGVPIGLHGGRLLLAHLSTPVQLSNYALMAQLYGLTWSVISTAGVAFWPIFVRRRAETEATIRMWWQVTAAFSAMGVVGGCALAAFGPWTGTWLSGGAIEISVPLALAFGALLVLQSAHLPAGVLLTRPAEARWQAGCIAVMALLGLGLGAVLAGPIGAAGVVGAALIGVLVGQVIPDLTWVPRLVRRRTDQLVDARP
ncbi:oligosaccharide flippase family protein [Aldersonia sp. NBC_00410]|uniref:lipopolysaccharide biosynthesis protein n=1 Tax=Aldersonia sp. NBC_00410 TaxID=2975954 RepID=UPI0022535A4C|nr:oligosaccharide flippase family protein [Aldersonia sp. NBC_00410]MCX5041689.1 oligosaccharide flippase family protein [Aldersonia sp. NBC_00410]